jgi:phosphate:Na+ symporter
VITTFHAEVVKAVDLARMAVTQKNAEAADRVSMMKSEINHLEQTALEHEAERLVADEPLRIPTYRFETDVLSNLKRIYYHAKRIARAAVPRYRRPEI